VIWLCELTILWRIGVDRRSTGRLTPTARRSAIAAAGANEAASKNKLARAWCTIYADERRINR
jgi:hypothetical protein